MRNNLRGWYKKRWAILARDAFTCQYCGQFAPNVRLEIDHKIPVAEGGTDDDGNLITTCSACNRGKGTLILDQITGKRLQKIREAGLLKRDNPNSARNRIKRLLMEYTQGLDLQSICSLLFDGRQDIARSRLNEMLKRGEIERVNSLYSLT